MTPPSDMRYAEIRSKRAQWLNWPYALVSVDWFVNTSATSDAGESAGVYTQIRMQCPGSSDIWLNQIRGIIRACRAATELASVFCSRTGVHAGLHRQGEVGHSRWTTADDWCSATAGPVVLCGDMEQQRLNYMRFNQNSLRMLTLFWWIRADRCLLTFMHVVF